MKGAILAPDGYQYGVMFDDGSVLARWSGSTQRARAREYAMDADVTYSRDRVTLARRLPGEPWERVDA